MMSDPTDHQVGDVSWRELGSGDPVLFLHGLGGSRIAWGPQLRSLSEEFRCIAWDMPGYGDSAPLVPLTYEGIADRLVMLLDTIEVDAVDLVGLSFGGMHALHTALKYPHRVGRMVLADTSPAFGMDGTKPDEWIRDRLAPIEAGGTPADAAEMVIDAITTVRLTGLVREETVAAFGRIPAAGFAAAVRCLPSNDIRSRLEELDHECLVIVGEHDLETPPAYAAALANGLRNAQLHTIEGVGHLTPAEAPEKFNQHVANFLR